MSVDSIVQNQVVANQTLNMTADTDLLPQSNDVDYNKKVNATNNDHKDSFVVINSNKTTKNTKKSHEKLNSTHQPQLAGRKNANVTDANLMRTLTRNNCSTVIAQNISKSWYARCNRWRSQSCDRRKSSSVRYSWNIVSNRPA